MDSLLEAHGERFMQMFDDYEDQQARELKQAQRRAARAAKQRKPTPDTPATVGQQANISARKEVRVAAASAAAPTPTASTSGRSRQLDEIDAILGATPATSKKRARSAPKRASNHQPLAQTAAATTTVGPSPSASVTPSGMLRLKAERKMFMSSKAGAVHEAFDPATVAQATAPRSKQRRLPAVVDDADFGMTAAGFRSIQMEVEKFGASGLDKMAHKEWQAKNLQRLGIKPEKQSRLAAPDGYKLFQSRKLKAEKAQQEAIDSGMLSRQTVAQTKRNKTAEAKKSQDRGLQEMGRGFSRGVLKLKGSPAKAAAAGGSRGRA